MSASVLSLPDQGGREIYRAEHLPVLQNRMFASTQAARACARGDVVLVQSRATGLVFNAAFQPELVQYGADYQNEQGLSAAFARELDAVVDVTRRHFAGQTLIEVGCGKGLFLERLLAAGFDITGLDPAYEGGNPRVIRKVYTPELGLLADGIVLRHVLEHVVDPVAFLAGLLESNGGEGKIYIEVPCLDWIVRHDAWFDICYEHVNYFRLADFERMFGTLHEVGHAFGGQYLYAVAELATLRMPRRRSGDDFEFPPSFLSSLDACEARLAAQPPGAPRVIWGGASKGVIFALFMERAGTPIDTVIDINPAKQGRHLAATGLRVQSPDEALVHLPEGTDVFVMNSNYLDEIEAATANRYHYLLIDQGSET
jgi:Methyltransferase domain